MFRKWPSPIFVAKITSGKVDEREPEGGGFGSGHRVQMVADCGGDGKGKERGRLRM